MQTFSLPIRIYLEDTDAQGVVYNASYFRFMERARTEWLRARGIDHTDLHDRYGVVLVLTSIAARFHAPAGLGDLIDVTATVVEARGARVVFGQTVTRANATDSLALCTGTAEVACKQMATGRPLRWPQDLLEELRR